MLRFDDVVPNVVFGQTIVHEPWALPIAATQPRGLSGFNLALHVQDDPLRVQQHRITLLQQFRADGVQQLTWLNQTHSTICHRVGDPAKHFANHPQTAQLLSFLPRQGDALVTSEVGHALIMMTADCLPVVLGNAAGTEIANLHAGWRGLAAGIIENTVAQMHCAPTWAWLGAAISQKHFEVGAEVRAAFLARHPQLAFAFRDASEHKFYADLYAIAGYILAQLGVRQILGGTACSYADASQGQHDYYSYRRDAASGRMATYVYVRAAC